jgi:predicted nucleotide-binding protein
VWTQGVFGLSENSLDSLEKLRGKIDYAILVLTPDDLLVSREQQQNTPRDNVIFELGYFMGMLGPKRAFMVFDRKNPPKLPSDLGGITPAKYELHSDGDLASSLGAACTKIRREMGLI